jgi:hypothetical protein
MTEEQVIKGKEVLSEIERVRDELWTLNKETCVIDDIYVSYMNAHGERVPLIRIEMNLTKEENETLLELVKTFSGDGLFRLEKELKEL